MIWSWFVYKRRPFNRIAANLRRIAWVFQENLFKILQEYKSRLSPEKQPSLNTTNKSALPSVSHLLQSLREKSALSFSQILSWRHQTPYMLKTRWFNICHLIIILCADDSIPQMYGVKTDSKILFYPCLWWPYAIKWGLQSRWWTVLSWLFLLWCHTVNSDVLSYLSVTISYFIRCRKRRRMAYSMTASVVTPSV